MRTLTLQVVGTTPILLHHISKHQLREQIASRGGATMSIEEEALNVMSKDLSGNPVVPVSWIWDALRYGCSRITVEGQQVSLFKLQSTIAISGDTILLMDTDGRIPTWEAYSSIQHKEPGSKKSIAVVAPMFRDWMLILQVVVRRDFQDNLLLNRIFAEAGKVGIGLFHPPKKQFGQFRISS